jgi:hypothetical protein
MTRVRPNGIPSPMPTFAASERLEDGGWAEADTVVVAEGTKEVTVVEMIVKKGDSLELRFRVEMKRA